jgi:putative transposase
MPTNLQQRHSFSRLLAHVVWSTDRRGAVIGVEDDDWLGRLLRGYAGEIGLFVIAIGVASDHVHVLVRYPPTLAIAPLVGRLKSASSRAWNQGSPRAARLDWQTGYWAESVSPSHAPQLVRYFEAQRPHHAQQRTHEPWESAT